MDKYLRQLFFLIYAFLLRWPIWLLIWLVGRSGILRTLFLIYPTDTSECLDFCPNIKWLRDFFSGRPTPAGLIMEGWRPMGIYLVIPNSSMELMRKKNRRMVETIISRMLWAQKFSGAKTIGLAGQLGPIFEKRHGIPMEPPFYSSTYGNIFSIQKAVSHLVTTSKKKPWQVSVSVIGGGLLGEQLEQHLASDGYQMSMVNVRYTRKGDVKLTNEEEANQQLGAVDFVINLLPRGKDFLDCRLHHRIPATATIVDFSRPPIPIKAIPQRVVMGNRVQRSGTHFFMRLPGGWKRHELPACSMPSLLASLGKVPIRNIEEFRLAARQFQFYTALAGAPVQPHTTFWNKLRILAGVHPIASRSSVAENSPGSPLM
ncbi:MAG: hypothetical protein GY799_04785 [Desulfobulbaceae bacterium]|nr:hypothetical protein [Desulfobulbaceae bacterium]